MIAVLNQMEILDQQIVPPWPIPEQFANLLKSREVELPPLGKRTRTLAGTVASLEPLRPTIDGAVLLHAPISFSDDAQLAQLPLRV
jgi:hypothetical protein